MHTCKYETWDSTGVTGGGASSVVDDVEGVFEDGRERQGDIHSADL